MTIRLVPICVVLLSAGCTDLLVGTPPPPTTAGSGAVIGAIGGNQPIGVPLASNGSGQLSVILFSPQRRNYDRVRGGDAGAAQRSRPSPSGRM